MDKAFVIDTEILALIGKLLGNNYIKPRDNTFIGKFKSLDYSVVMELCYFNTPEEIHKVEVDCYWANLLDTNEERVKKRNNRIPAYLQGLCSQLEMKKYEICVEYGKQNSNSCTIKFYKKKRVDSL